MSELIPRALSQLADRYSVERPLDGGGMAAVFVAQDLRHERRVVLKMYSPDLASAIDPHRFLREIKVTAGFQHPHILPLLDSGEAEGVLYYVMPFVEGETLRARLGREKRLSLEEAVTLTREIAGALDYANVHGVVHRDVKPANILLSDGHAIVADFGIAWAMDGAGWDALTRTGTSVGTPQYMSPEQAGGGQSISGRSDQYSLACVVFEMLAGVPPFSGATVDTVVHQHLSVPAPPVTNLRPGLPNGVSDVISRALSKVPADRFPTSGAFAKAFETAAGGALSLPHESRQRHRSPQAPWIAAAAAALSLALLGVGVWFWRHSHSVAESPIAIAVLPLEDLTQDEARMVFADGLTEELITELSKIGSIRVSARSAVMRYRSSRAPLRTVARELHVNALIEGSVLRVGSRVRITARLIDPKTEQQRWTQDYERDMRDILALQAEVAEDVARQLRAKLTAQDAVRATKVGPVDPAAHEATLRGLYFLERLDGSNYRKAIGYFEDAIRADPAYAPAWAGVAEAYYNLSSLYLPASEAMPKARAAAQHALEIDPDLAVAHGTLAMVRAQYDFKWASADSGFRRAIALNPSLARVHANYGYMLAEIGRFKDSELEWEKAVALDPLSVYYSTGLGMPFFFSKRYTQALATYEGVTRNDSTYAPPRYMAAIIYSQLGRHDRAIQEARAALPLADTPFSLAVLASAYGFAGQTREATAILDQLLREKSGVEGVYLARVYLSLGRIDEAFQSLEQSLRERNEDVINTAVDPTFAPLRRDPRFQHILRELNLRP